WLIHGVQSRDYPVVQGGILLIAAIVISVNLIVDLLYGVINPRIRHALCHPRNGAGRTGRAAGTVARDLAIVHAQPRRNDRPGPRGWPHPARGVCRGGGAALAQRAISG